MKDKESSLDIYAFINIYRKDIVDSFFKKVYELGQGRFIFQIHSQTIKNVPLYLDVKKGICFMDTERGHDAGQTAMYLRKLFMDRKIKDISQINFDRVVRIDMYSGISLVIELFRDGNLIVLNDGIIDYALFPREWKNRKIIKGERYIPPSLFDPLNASKDQIQEIMGKRKASIVQTLATRMNYGGDLAEEVLYRMGVNKDAPPKLSDDDIEKLKFYTRQILDETAANKSYYYNDGTVSPVELHHKERDILKVVENFNDGISEVIQKETSVNPENEKIRRIVENQERAIREYEEKVELYRNQGNFISSHFQDFSRAIKILKGGIGEGGIINLDGIKLTVVKKDLAERKALISTGDMEIEIEYEKSVGENMERLFNTSKEFKEKIEGARVAMEKSLSNITEERERKKKIRQKFWFEIYHWFFTKNGKMVLSGKNTDTNEKVVKKYLEENDIYVHADMYGAPSTVIKKGDDGNPITEEDIREAAIFAVSFSRAWQNGLASGSAYWVTPQQVSKTPESGQYVRKGSWIVRGKRNYIFELPLKLSIRPIEYKGIRIPMISPPSGEAGEITIIPGGRKKDKIAKEIGEKLEFDPEEIIQILPTGEFEIVSS